MQLILGPRPGKKSKESIQSQGVTDILSLLSQREQPESIKRIANSIGATWHHFPIDGGNIETLDGVDLGRLIIIKKKNARAGDEAVMYLHCSAGLHRTGFVAYALLRYRGVAPDQVMDELRALRAVTADEVGADRVALAEAKFLAWQAA